MFSKSLKDFFKNPIIALPNIIFVVITQFLIFLLFGNIPDNLVNPSLELNTQAAATIALSFLLFVIISLFVTPFILSWASLLAKKTVDGEKPNLMDCLKESMKYYWRLLGVTVLIGLIIFAVYIVMMIMFIATIGTSILSSPEQINASVGITAIILFIIFLLGIIFLAVTMSPIQSVLVYDDLSIGDAFSKGFKLGIKKFFPILGFSLLVGLCTGVIGLIFTYIFGQNSSITDVITSLIGGYLAILPTVFILNLYRENKSKNEYNSAKDYTFNNNAETYHQWNDIYNKDENSHSNENTQIPEKEDENKPDNSNFRI